MAELRDHPADQPPRERAPNPDRPGRWEDDHAMIRATIDHAVRDPAFALTPEQETDLKRAWAMSPADSTGYRPPIATDTGRFTTDLDNPLPSPNGLDTARTGMRDIPGLPAITDREAAVYLSTARLNECPRLRSAEHATVDARRVIAAIDQSDGHHLRRHEGAASGQAARDLAECLHDPANVDPASKARADDGSLTEPPQTCRDPPLQRRRPAHETDERAGRNDQRTGEV